MKPSDVIQSAMHGMPTMVTGGKPGYRAGEEKLAWNHANLAAPNSITVRSDAFGDQMPIPKRFSVDGQEVSPPLAWSGLPENTKSVALVVEDPDAPTPEPYVHWLMYNIDPSTTMLSEDARLASDQSAGPMEGKNSGLKIGWTGMAPPKGDTPHRYFFQVFALNTKLSLKSGAGRSALFEAMAGRVLGRSKIMGTYQR